MCYTSKAPQEWGEENEISRVGKMSKTFEEKVLTKGKRCDILTKLSARAGSERTLKIEQRKTRENKARNVEKTNQKELVEFLRRSTQCLTQTF